MKRLVTWLMVVMFGAWGLVSMAADLATSPYAKSVAAYKAATSAVEKANFLVGLVNANDAISHGAFYELLRTAEGNEIPYFKAALKRAKTPALLLDLGAYTEAFKAPFIEEIKKNPQMSLVEKLQLQEKANNLIRPFQVNIEKVQAEIAIVAKKDPVALIRALKKAFVEKEGSDADMAGPIIGIGSMGEEGAVLVLKSFEKDGEDSGALSLMSKVLGPNMVIPAIKQSENPACTSSERETANLVIFMLPDVEPVYDKVVEAYRHGRYYEQPELKTDKDGKVAVTLAEMVTMAASWWGNSIKGKYRDVDGFVAYVAEKHLDEPVGQEKIIALLADVNFGEAAPYFMGLDVSKLPKESVEALFHACYVLPTSNLAPSIGGIGAKKEYKVEKFKVFEHLFRALDPDVRRKNKTIYALPGYLPRSQVLFVKNNLGILTDEEKTTIAFLCGSKDGDLHEPLSNEDIKTIFGLLRQGASKELLQIIDHMEKN